MSRRVRIAIDGPSASGKTTTARAVARRLGYRYLDSGALYRCLGLKISQLGVDPDDAGAVAAVVSSTTVEYDDEGRAWLDGQLQSGALRTPEVADLASRASVHPAARDWITARLRDAAAGGGVVVEGRDIGTVVLPDAEVKVFLSADLQVRAERRFTDLQESGHGGALADVAEDLRRRDERDSARAAAPLVPAEGAVLLDGSHLSFEEQVEAVLALVRDVA